MSTTNDLIKRLRDALITKAWNYSNQDYGDCTALIAEADAYLAQPVQEPVAWLHDSRPTAEAITDEVKKLLLRWAPKKVEHYTIPLNKANDFFRQADLARIVELEATIKKAAEMARATAAYHGLIEMLDVAIDKASEGYSHAD